jgi:glycosyltransferase involved in cell wall biosynthesis
VSERAVKPMLFLLGTLEIGGSETKFVNMAVRLRKMGLPVHVAYLRPPEELKQKLVEVPLVHLGRNGKWSAKAFRNLSRYVVQERIATIVTVNPYPLSYAVPLAIVRRGSQLRVIASINTSDYLSARERRFMLLFATLLRRCAVIVFGARSQQQNWLQEYRLPQDRSCVIHNGVDSSVFDPAQVVGSRSSLRRRLGIPDDAFVLVCVGQFRPEKAHDNLVKAVHALQQQRQRSPHMLFVGDGPERVRIEALVEESGLAESVHFVGAVSDVRPYLKMSNLFVLTSVAVETFSNAALEASVMGLPAVVSDVGGAKEMFPSSEYAVVYPRDDIGALVAAIARFVDAGPLSERNEAQVREQISARFSVESMDAQWQETIWPQEARRNACAKNASENKEARPG